MEIVIAREARGTAQLLNFLADGRQMAINYCPSSASAELVALRGIATRSDVSYLSLHLITIKNS